MEKQQIVKELEELLSHLGGEMQRICDLDTGLELLSLLGIFLKAFHYLLIEEFEHYRNHQDSCRSYFLNILCDVLETFADGNCSTSVNLA